MNVNGKKMMKIYKERWTKCKNRLAMAI